MTPSTSWLQASAGACVRHAGHAGRTRWTTPSCWGWWSPWRCRSWLSPTSATSTTQTTRCLPAWTVPTAPPQPPVGSIKSARSILGLNKRVLGPYQEYWHYSYPLRTRNTVPSWAVPLIATLVPAAAFALHNFLVKPSRLEAHNTLLACWSAVFATALVTNLVKLGVRPRGDQNLLAVADAALHRLWGAAQACSLLCRQPGSSGTGRFPGLAGGMLSSLLAALTCSPVLRRWAGPGQTSWPGASHRRGPCSTQACRSARPPTWPPTLRGARASPAVGLSPGCAEREPGRLGAPSMHSGVQVTMPWAAQPALASSCPQHGMLLRGSWAPACRDGSAASRAVQADSVCRPHLVEHLGAGLPDAVAAGQAARFRRRSPSGALGCSVRADLPGGLDRHHAPAGALREATRVLDSPPRSDIRLQTARSVLPMSLSRPACACRTTGTTGRTWLWASCWAWALRTCSTGRRFTR